ncbi:nucleoside hydrolase [Microbacterium hominis]|uniref:Nucleoside hydrolase n=1 Tax=Microbacterium hominis TaxID=162426 RepID=A0A7D4U6P4_9MICO|nr:nucleoside hydrolase [Microbacterium hominis]QKJ18566.1 nucleoside hydrolase [Microbacterium hominis]
MRAAHRVILDTDIGSDVDDAMALSQLLGHPEVDLIGVTTVYGDTLLRARLARRLGHLAGREIPVHVGRTTPLSGREVWWAGHEGGLYEGLERETVEATDAIDYLVEQVVAHPGEIDVIAIGPLTNIAAAITADARFATAVRHLWIMGGAFTSQEPEHNFRSDTHAAEIVFASGIPMTITGLEATRQVEIRRDELARIGAAGELGAILVAEIEQWWKFWNEEWNVPHDPVAVLTLIEPELFEFSPLGIVTVERDGDAAGRSTFTAGDGSARVVTGLDGSAVGARIVAAIERAGLGATTEAAR